MTYHKVYVVCVFEDESEYIYECEGYSEAECLAILIRPDLPYGTTVYVTIHYPGDLNELN
jgi:hypothetical protein